MYAHKHYRLFFLRHPRENELKTDSGLQVVLLFTLPAWAGNVIPTVLEISTICALVNRDWKCVALFKCEVDRRVTETER